MTDGAAQIIVAAAPSAEDRAAILEPLIAYNRKQAGSGNATPLALLVKDDSGETIGGLWGKSVYDWLFVEYLAVPDQFRGQDLGTALLKQAEDIARDRGCAGVWLDTYSFQAPEFYRKQGYELFGTLPDHPRGGHRYFYKKAFG